ncbi:malate dehydrogenase [Halomarina ordinaria]|uniref:malate dehydrogenase n=1 Tax=Halomarina ordinaria TaxID=3033939 RepID=A0ABD5U4A9_9EURY|nr:lactate dehydrogenase [Halomarina sp. PSRA2]
MQVTVIGGAGTIGAATAYTLALDRPTLDVALCDVERDAARGDATDVTHARAHVAHPVGRSSGDRPGAVRAVDPGPGAIEDADVVVVAASGAGTQTGGRMAAIEANRAVVDEVAAWFPEHAPRPVVTVTNPLDRMNYRLFRRVGWERSRFVGYALSETARVADELARRHGTTAERVSCPVVGEHGEHIVPLFSRASVDGDPLDLSAEEREAVTEYARRIPYDVIDWRGARHSSRWVTARGVAALTGRLLDGGLDTPVGLSTPLDGEYGYEGVSLGVPVTLDADGIDAVHEWDLPADERAALDAAYEAVRATPE